MELGGEFLIGGDQFTQPHEGTQGLRRFRKDKTGLVVVDGELIELPVVRSMYRVLAIAERTTSP